MLDGLCLPLAVVGGLLSWLRVADPWQILCFGDLVSDNSLHCKCRQDLKELKFRPSTDVHDYQVRLRSAQKFIAKVRALLQHKHELSLHFGKAISAPGLPWC